MIACFIQRLSSRSYSNDMNLSVAASYASSSCAGRWCSACHTEIFWRQQRSYANDRHAFSVSSR